MNKGINLLKTREMRVQLPTDKPSRLRLVAFSLLFIISVFSTVLFVLIAFSPLPKLKIQENNARSALLQFDKDIARLSFINQRSVSINNILSKQKIFSVVIQAIESKIPTEVAITEFEITQKEISLTFSSGSLRAIDTLIEELVKSVEEKKYFSQIILKNFSRAEKDGEYLLTIHLVNL